MTKNLDSIILALLFLAIFCISLINFYGNDVDTYAILNTFIKYIDTKNYYPSRIYGSPFAEFFLGFLIYNFGAKITNLLVCVIFITSIFFFYKSYIYIKYNIEKKLFLLLCLSNPILLFDNINISDYPLALFFFSMGMFFFKKNNYLGVILLSLSVACRTNFIIFVSYYIIIVNQISLTYKIKNFTLMYVIIFLFYFPALNFYDFQFIKNSPLGGLRFDISSNYKFDFINQFGRFFYKIVKSIGFLQTLIILFLVLLNLSRQKIKYFIFKFYKELNLILLNLFVFILHPTKTSIISVALILFYIIIIKNIKKKFILIFLI